jgi:hypothetical protein
VLKVQLVLKVLRDPKVPKVQWVHKALLVHKAHKVLKVP